MQNCGRELISSNRKSFAAKIKLRGGRFQQSLFFIFLFADKVKRKKFSKPIYFAENL